MTTAPQLGIFELLTLMAVSAGAGKAYGVTIRRDVSESRGADVSSGAIYTTLERLERRGLVISRRGDAAEVRGGHPRRYYRLTRDGERTMQANYGAVRALAGRLSPRLLKS
jgi:DNA-binding PadR family transcriptional regulator